MIYLSVVAASSWVDLLKSSLLQMADSGLVTYSTVLAFFCVFQLGLSNFVLSMKGYEYNVIFRNKRSQAKGVYYVFLYKQQLDNVYTRVAIHRFTLSPLHTVAHGC